jgi:hypothetical protein
MWDEDTNANSPWVTSVVDDPNQSNPTTSFTANLETENSNDNHQGYEKVQWSVDVGEDSDINLIQPTSKETTGSFDNHEIEFEIPTDEAGTFEIVVTAEIFEKTDADHGGDDEDGRNTYTLIANAVLHIIKVEIDPVNMLVNESEDSNNFSVIITPQGLNPTYKWLSGAENDAWPEEAGNEPELDYDDEGASSTTVKKTRWFAPTNNRLYSVDGDIATYKVNCKVTIGGVDFTAKNPSLLNVYVNLVGSTTRPTFFDQGSIQVEKINNIWTVKNIGNFKRTPPVPSASVPPDSQFHEKIMAHENKHVNQFTNEFP